MPCNWRARFDEHTTPGGRTIMMMNKEQHTTDCLDAHHSPSCQNRQKVIEKLPIINRLLHWPPGDVSVRASQTALKLHCLRNPFVNASPVLILAMPTLQRVRRQTTLGQHKTSPELACKSPDLAGDLPIFDKIMKISRSPDLE